LSRIGIVSRIFNYEVWIIVITSFCIAVVFIWCLARNSNKNDGHESRTYKTISKCVTSLWAVTMGGSNTRGATCRSGQSAVHIICSL
jgi:hypothetical protein